MFDGQTVNRVFVQIFTACRSMSTFQRWDLQVLGALMKPLRFHKAEKRRVLRAFSLKPIYFNMTKDRPEKERKCDEHTVDYL